MSSQNLSLPKIFCSKGGLHNKELINQICLNPNCVKNSNFLLCITCSDIDHDQHETIPAKLLLSEILLSLDKSPDNLYRKFEDQKFQALRTLQLLRSDFEVYLTNLEEKINNLYQQIQNNITDESFQFASHEVLNFINVLQKSRSLDEIKESLKNLLDRINLQSDNQTGITNGINLMNKAKKSSIILDLSSKQQEIFNSMNKLSKDLQNIFEKNQIQITKISTETDLNLKNSLFSEQNTQKSPEVPQFSQSSFFLNNQNQNQNLNQNQIKNYENENSDQIYFTHENENENNNNNQISDFISENMIPCPKRFQKLQEQQNVSHNNNSYSQNFAYQENPNFYNQNQIQSQSQSQNFQNQNQNYQNQNFQNQNYQNQSLSQNIQKQSSFNNIQQNQSSSQVNNSVFSICEEQSHSGIQIKDNKIKNNRYYGKEQVYRVSTLLPSLQQSLPKVQTWSYKILDCLPSWIGFGMGHIRNLKENEFQYKRNDFSLSTNQPLNHGLYIVTSNGFAFKNGRRPEKTNFFISKGDTITIRFDPFMNLLIFYKNFDSTNPYNMEFKTELANKLYPLVILWYPNDEVMLLQ